MMYLANKLNDLDRHKKDLILNQVNLLAEENKLTPDTFFKLVADVVESEEKLDEVRRCRQ